MISLELTYADVAGNLLYVLLVTLISRIPRVRGYDLLLSHRVDRAVLAMILAVKHGRLLAGLVRLLALLAARDEDYRFLDVLYSLTHLALLIVPRLAGWYGWIGLAIGSAARETRGD